jgi:hypothetical protein
MRGACGVQARAREGQEATVLQQLVEYEIMCKAEEGFTNI